MRDCCSRVRFKLRLILPLLALATVAGAGASLIPEATPSLAERAARRWPDANLEQLELGRTLYIKRCSGCHNLHLPSEKAPDEWAGALDEMAMKARLDEYQKTAVLRYLAAASALVRDVSLAPAPMKPAEPAASASEPDANPPAPPVAAATVAP